MNTLFRMIIWRWQVNWLFEHSGIDMLIVSIVIANKQYESVAKIIATER